MEDEHLLNPPNPTVRKSKFDISRVLHVAFLVSRHELLHTATSSLPRRHIFYISLGINIQLPFHAADPKKSNRQCKPTTSLRTHHRKAHLHHFLPANSLKLIASTATSLQNTPLVFTPKQLPGTAPERCRDRLHFVLTTASNFLEPTVGVGRVRSYGPLRTTDDGANWRAEAVRFRWMTCMN